MKDLTPKKYRCDPLCPSCPSIYKTENNTYIIIGKRVLYKDLEDRTGPDEAQVEIPQDLLEEVNEAIAKERKSYE